MRLRLEFKPQDLWVGAFWKTTPERYWDRDVPIYKTAVTTVYGHRTKYRHDLWVCLLPCVPLHLTWYTEPPRVPEGD